MIRWLKSWLTMKRICYEFTDVVDGGGVWLYTDCYGDKFLASYVRWGFRVRLPDQKEREE